MTSLVLESKEEDSWSACNVFDRSSIRRGVIHMPTYEYICKECNKTFVLISTISQHEKDQKPACVNCGSKNVEQYYSSVTVITSKKS
jgi:putative FmdB family regulatory protein